MFYMLYIEGDIADGFSQKPHLFIKSGMSFKTSNFRSGASGRVGKITVYSIFGVPYQTDLLSCFAYGRSPGGRKTVVDIQTLSMSVSRAR